MAAGSSAPELFASIIGEMGSYSLTLAHSQYILYKCKHAHLCLPFSLSPSFLKVSSSLMETWVLEPQWAQRCSTFYASSVCAESSLDRCVRACVTPMCLSLLLHTARMGPLCQWGHFMPQITHSVLDVYVCSTNLVHFEKCNLVKFVWDFT